jgi:hypothetical protein
LTHANVLWGGGGSHQEIEHVSDKSNFVLVRPAWADGSFWSAVIELPRTAGQSRNALQYAIRHPLTTSSMTRHKLAAAILNAVG